MRVSTITAALVALVSCVNTPAALAQSAPIWQGWYAGVDGGGQKFSGSAHPLTTRAFSDHTESEGIPNGCEQ